MKERLCEGEQGMNTISAVRMLTATRGEAHQSCTQCGLAFFKKPREATAIPLSHKSVMTYWQLGCDWLKTVCIKGERQNVQNGCS